ncbi:MAG: hypothetical protein KDD38_02555 [Bdellovibrionales bacterium]|nr:hypothetical protein [Bdellovibrionales bacterium]
MKIINILICFMFSQTVAAEQAHDHHHHEKTELKLSFNNGKKWPTDLALRSNMDAIHDHIKSKIKKIHAGDMTDGEFKKLGEQIKTNTDDIFKNCKLEPEADAQLHLVMAGILTASEKLVGKASLQEKRKAVDEILSHYKSYLKYFDHKN